MATQILVLTFCISLCLGYTFGPEHASEITDARIPVLFNISNTQTLSYKEASSIGYWATSFLTGSNNHQYFLVSAALASPETSRYGGSILDLNTTKRWSYIESGNFSSQQLESFNLTAPSGYGFTAASEDKISQMRTWSNQQGLTFDLTIHATSPALYYGGTGAYYFVNGYTYAWALPACETTGTLTIDDEVIQIDAAQSLTWYDHLWQDRYLTRGNWTFFELHFDSNNIVAIMHAVDNEEPHFMMRSTQIRATPSSDEIVPLSLFVPKAEGSWVSPRTGIEYPSEWEVGVEGKCSLTIKSFTPDQELAGRSVGDSIYEGFMTFSGEYEGEGVTGFGVVEMRRSFLF